MTLVQRPSQLRFQPLQLGELAPDDGQFLGNQVPDVDAHLVRMPLDRKQLADFTERKTELLRLLDKLQIGDLTVLVQPITARAASGPW